MTLRFLPAVLTMCMATFTSAQQTLRIDIINPINISRDNETVELDADSLCAALSSSKVEQLAIFDAEGNRIPSQITYDGKFIFQTSMNPAESTSYYITQAEPATFPSSVFGKQYKERLDDFAWENDYTIYRLYGPALQATGERSFGFDAWVKNTRNLELENFYHEDYHNDHGRGLDCYGVGPTLGCGAPALMHDGEIVYPWSYDTLEILENGPLRMTARLVYCPSVIGNDSTVTETRILSIDKGTRLTRLTTRFDNLSQPSKIAVGLVMHPANHTEYICNPTLGYNAYRDSAGVNGSVYVGAVFSPGTDIDARPLLFSDEERNTLRNGASGHVVGIADYTPSSDYTYYIASVWSKDGMDDINMWGNYLQEAAVKLRNPLKIKITPVSR